MFKKILIALCSALAACYLLLAITAFNRRPAGRACAGLELLVRDSLDAGFITGKELLALLDKEGLNPVGKQLDEVDTRRMETALGKHPLIDAAECYKTPGDKVCVEVRQRIPILRVMSSDGEDYYIDAKGRAMPTSTRCTAHLPVVTGCVSKDFALKELYPFGLFLQQNDFWGAQTEQIHVLADQTVELAPRVGDHLIYLGKLKHYRQKLKRVKLFYEKALNRVGWNKYSRINVEFDNQIICTRRQ